MVVDDVANKPLIEQKAKNNNFSLPSSTGTTRPHSDVQEHTTKVILPHSLFQESYASNNTVHAFTAPSLSSRSLRGLSSTSPISIVTPGQRDISSSTFSVRINTPHSNSHRPDPIHLAHTVSSNFSSAKSLPSSRRLSHLPYIVPFPSARLPRWHMP